MSKRWRSLHALVALMLLGVGTTLRADNTVTGVTIAPADPNDICIGDSVTYRVNYTGGDPIQSVQWQYTCTDCTPPRVVVCGSGNTQLPYNEDLIGHYTVQATVTFNRYPTSQTYQSSSTLNVTVNPPNKIVVDPQFLNKPTPLLPPGSEQPNLYVKMTIYRNDRQAYVWPSTVKEKLDRNKYGKAPDFPWSTAPFLTVTGIGQISDGKGVINADPVRWNAVPAGFVTDEFDQSIRITFPTSCGANQDFDLSPTLHFQMQKVDNGNWQLVLK